jgi:hypothetical protein
MSENTAAEQEYDVTPPPPSPQLQALDRLVGTWRVTGGAEGTVTYEWMDGGYFLLQRVRLEQFGQPVTGIEVIGNLRPFGQPPSEDVHSRFYDSTGNTLDYVYELEGDTLHIWALEKGSEAYFKGTFEPGDKVMDGAWVYPGGGGYESRMTRIDD